MRTLYTIAIPTLSVPDARFVASLRAQHDRHVDVVAPHFTLVFACSAVDETAYRAHVRAVAASSTAVDFACRYAMLGADDESDSAYVYLVPDAGYAALSLLHDALYTGPLGAQLRLDLPFVPHITLGNFAQRPDAKRHCESLNARGIRIDGRVEALTVGTIAAGRFEAIERCALRDAS